MKIPRYVLGYLCSVIVAAILLTLMALQVVSYYSSPQHGLLDIFYVWVVLGFWTIIVTILPASVLILLAERKGWHSAFLYTAAGSIFGLPVGVWFDTQVMLECIVIGAVAGFTYWLLAGRYAGLRTKPEA
jgi:hypothetical protein